MTPRRRVFVIAAVLAAAAVLALLGWRQWRPAVVAAVAVQPAPLVRTLQFSARVAAPQRVELGATVTARVRDVLVGAGDAVRAGQPLLRLEDAEWQAALAQAVAGEAQAEARLAGLRGSGRRGVEAGVAQAESVARAADAELKRTQELVARGFVSAARLDEARRAADVAQAQLDAARAQLSATAERGGSDLAQALAQRDAARAATQAARARLAQTLLAAPADARVLARQVEPGQIVQPGRPLLTLALAGPVELLALVDERYLQQLRAGQPAGVRADAYPAQRFDATVRSIAPLVDAQRGAVEVRLAVAAPPLFLREDMTLSVEVETARRARALVVPLAALRGDGGAGVGGVGNGGSGSGAELGDPGTPAVVWVERGGRVAAQAVRLGLRTLDGAEVLAGLNPGDRVLLGDAAAPGARVVAALDDGARAAAGRVGSGSSGGTGDAGSALTNAVGR